MQDSMVLEDMVCIFPSFYLDKNDIFIVLSSNGRDLKTRKNGTHCFVFFLVLIVLTLLYFPFLIFAI